MELALPVVPRSSLAVAGRVERFPLGRVYCAGRNYPWPDSPSREREAPFFFMKPAAAVVPAIGTLPYPRQTAELCHEVELVVAIGQDGIDLAPEDALDHVWGYAVGLDLTRRDHQRQARQSGRPWEAAKAFDASAPCSALVPATASGHPRSGTIWLSVNGQPRQRADLRDLLWPVPELLAALSRCFTLRAGDLVFTGTPHGVGVLEPGDAVAAGVDGIGRLEVEIGAAA
jgi:fumarylpyruvate hydrolase